MKRNILITIIIFLINGLLPVISFANDIFKDEVPYGLGVNIHTHASFPKSLDEITAAGFKVIRTNLYWHQIEKIKTAYDWHNYDKLIQKMDKAGIRPLLALSFSNPLYEPMHKITGLTGNKLEKAAPPTHEDSIRAFAKFAATAAHRYRKSNIIWEIWNEPNYKVFWVPEPNASDYANLANATCTAIKKLVPEAIVIAPSSSGTPFDDNHIIWWKEFLEKVNLDCIDAISVHPYVWNTNKGPYINIEKYNHLRELILEYTTHNAPIISSEFGFSSSDWNIYPKRQAALLVRNYIINLMENIPISIWYDWRDDGTNPKEREHNFGITKRNGEKKPLFYAAQTLSNYLNGYKFGKRIDNNDKDIYLIMFKHPTKPPILVAWTVKNTPKEISISLTDIENADIEARDILGDKTKYHIKNNNIIFTISEIPQYIMQKDQNSNGR